MGALDCVSKRGMISGTDSTEVFTINLSSNSTLNDSRRDLESQSKCNTKSKRHSVWWTVAIDIPLFILVLAVILLFEIGVFPSYKSGFYCNDPALSYSFTGDTVSMVLLVMVVLLLPIGMIYVTELIFADSDDSFRSKASLAARTTLWLNRSYIYGFLFNLCLIEVMKGITGSPRPTFFEICEPDTAKTCNGSEFVATFECTSTKHSAWFQQDSYHSFPSGHTSLSIHCGLFLAWYLQKRAFDWSHRTVVLVPVLQLCVIFFAIVSSLTRITDNRHHWWDVVVGTVIGFCSVFYTVAVLCDNFSYMKPKYSVKNSDDSQQTLKTPIFDARRGDITP